MKDHFQVDTEWLVAMLSFFVCLGYNSLNETAAELEHPFGLGANHLQLTAYQRQFNSKLAHLFDQMIPELGYAAGGAPGNMMSSPRRTSKMQQSTSTSKIPTAVPEAAMTLEPP